MTEPCPMADDEEDLAFERWEESFRAEAQRDQSRVLKDHLHRLGLRENPEFLLEGTIDFVRASVVYLRLDAQGINELLTHQRYTVSIDPDTLYALTFDVCGRSYGRLVVSSTFKYIDLADLFNHPWHRLKLAGYSFGFRALMVNA